MTTKKTSVAAELKRAEQQNRLLRLTMANAALLSRQNKLDKIRTLQARYDGVEGSTSPTGAKRRRATTETAGETGAASLQLPPYKRLLAVALLRDAARNFSMMRSMLLQLRLNVVGWRPELTIRHGNGQSAQDWFNKTWAPNSDFRDGLHLAEQWGILLETVFREGDLGMLFDGPLLNTGRMAYYETDQICDPPSDALKEGQESFDGVIRDKYGRMVGFCVARDRGRTVAEKGRFEIFPRDPEDETKNFFKLVRMPFRFNQGRGISPMLTPLADLLDIYEMRAKEMQTAKAAAAQGAIVKREEATEDYDDERLDPDYKGSDTGPAATANLPEGDTAKESPVYDRLGALTGGMTEYIDAKDTVEWLKIDRPNVHLAEFFEHVGRTSGAGVGFARCYTEMKAESSYTAFRGELVLTWVLFDYLQDWFENEVQDWTAKRAIRDGIEKKKCTAPDDGWESELHWGHPKMPSVNEAAEQTALTQRIKNGDVDLDDLFGPDFDKWLEDYAAKMKKIKEKAPWFAALEMKSGGQVKEEAAPPPGDDDDNDDEKLPKKGK